MLVSAQLAISTVLLIIASVILNGFRSQVAQGPGFQTEHLFLVSFDSQMRRYSAAQNEQFYKRLLDAARSAPGVRSATLTSVVPFGYGSSTAPVVPEGRTLGRSEQPFPIFDSVVSAPAVGHDSGGRIALERCLATGACIAADRPWESIPNMPAFDARTMQDLFHKRAVQTPNILVEAVAGMGVMGLVPAVTGL